MWTKTMNIRGRLFENIKRVLVEEKFFLIILLMAVLCLSLTSCASSEELVSQEEIMANMTEDTYYIMMSRENGDELLLSSEDVYEDGDSNVAAAVTIYLEQENGYLKVGEIQSDGTAYPVKSDENGFYVGSGYKVELYDVVDGTLVLLEGCYVSYDEDGAETYSMEGSEVGKDYTTEEAQSEYEKLEAVYGEAKVIAFM